MRYEDRKDQERKRRELRSQMTDAEKVLWRYLRRKQLKGRVFRRQHSIGSYIVDFYCHAEGLVIEVDGDIHFDEGQLIYDQKRTTYLQSKGLKVIRFNNWEIFRSIQKVVQKIISEFENELDDSTK